jgi:hypothetical protein
LDHRDGLSCNVAILNDLCPLALGVVQSLPTPTLQRLDSFNAASKYLNVATVELGTEVKGQYPVIGGLSVGERVVTEGSFLLCAEWLKGPDGARTFIPIFVSYYRQSVTLMPPLKNLPSV